MKKVKIETGSRLHFALMDMTGDMGRVDGGIGLALKDPRIVIEAEIHKGISSDAQAPLVEATIQKLRERYELDSGMKVHVIDSYPAHVGLGSSTQFILSVATAYMRLNNKKVGARELAGLLGRGGTSSLRPRSR